MTPDVRFLRRCETPVVSVVVPSLDGDRQGNVARLVQALGQQTIDAIEVLLVVGVRPNGRARNVGARRAQGRYLVFIDDDVLPGSDDLLDRMIAVFHTDPRIAMVGCSQLVPLQANLFQRRCATQLDRVQSPVIDHIEDTDMATHLCVALPRELYLAIGGEHEHLPRGTDPELRARLRALGYRVVLAPQTWAYHPPPDSWRTLLRTYFRNGFGSRYVADQFPEGTLPTATGHGAAPHDAGTFGRAVRFASRMAIALARGQFIRLVAHAAYAAGYLNAWLFEPQWRRIVAKRWFLRVAVHPFATVRRLARPHGTEHGVRFLLYHRISNKRYRNLIVHHEAFAQQMAWLADHCSVLSLAHALELLQNDGSLSEDTVVLTFDDITREWEQFALPVLQRHRLPATIFVAACTVDSEVEFPWLRNQEPPDYHPLTTDQIRRLVDAGIGLGSHTWSHRRLADCSPAEQAQELAEGRHALERVVGAPVLDLAYPYGRAKDVPITAVDSARRQGFRCGLAVRTALNLPGCDPFLLVRTAIDPGDTLGLFRAKVQGRLDIVAPIGRR